MDDDAQITQETAKRIIGTPFKPGNAGKPVGTQNKLTRTVKETVLAVFNDLESDPKKGLKAFAEKYPRDFYQIAARLIPTEITGSIKQVIIVTDTGESN